MACFGEIGSTLEARVAALEGGVGGTAEYDPVRAPTGSIAINETFANGAEVHTWEDGGAMGSATFSLEKDGALLWSANATDTWHIARWVNPGVSGSWVASMIAHASRLDGGANTRMAGMGVLRAGTVASPTALSWLYLGETSAGFCRAGVTSGTTTYQSTANVILPIQVIAHYGETGRWFQQIRYDATADTLEFFISFGGILRFPIGTQTGVTADPVRVGFHIRTISSLLTELFVESFRVRAGTSLDFSD